MKLRFCLGFIGLLMAVPLFASSVLQVSLEDMVRSSELVFEGRVLNKRAELDKAGVIKTYVTFELVDVYKGSHTSRTIELPFLGGTVGQLTMEVSDLTTPDLGERGIYFVESVAKPPANPLYGWDQGHLIVRTDASDRTDHVFTRGGKPIVGFESAAKATGLSNGVAAGLTLADSDRAGRGLTIAQFKQKVRELLGSR